MNVNIRWWSKRRSNIPNKDDRSNAHWLDQDFVFSIESWSRNVIWTKDNVYAQSTVFDGQSVSQSAIECDKEKENEKNISTIQLPKSKQNERRGEKRRTMNRLLYRRVRVRIDGQVQIFSTSFFLSFSTSFAVRVHWFNEMREPHVSCDRKKQREREEKSKIEDFILTLHSRCPFPFPLLMVHRFVYHLHCRPMIIDNWTRF